jgi:hypothetical protein
LTLRRLHVAAYLVLAIVTATATALAQEAPSSLSDAGPPDAADAASAASAPSASAANSRAASATTVNVSLAQSALSVQSTQVPSTSERSEDAVCTIEQLESLAQSVWWERLPVACTAMIPLGARPVDPPADVEPRRWHSFVQQCRHRQSHAGRALCDADERERASWIESFSQHARSLGRRALELEARCRRLPEARAALARVPESSRARAESALSSLERFCANSAAPLLDAATIGGLAPLFGVDASDGRSDRDASSASSGTVGGEGTGRSESAGFGRGSSGTLPTPAGMLDLAVQGLAQLVVQRAQAELEAFAIDSLRQSLCSERVRPWFEHTCDFLGPGGESSLRVSVGQGLRAAFQSDVLALPTRALETLPRRGTARGLTALLYFDLLAAWVQNPDPNHAAARVLTLADAWEPWSDAEGARRSREIEASRVARASVLSAGLLLSAATNRSVFDRLPDSAFVPLVAAMLDRELTEEDRRKTRVFRGAIAQYRAVGQGVRVTGRGAIELNATRAAAALRAVVDLLNAAVDLACPDRTIAQMVTMPGRMPELVVAISRGDLSRIVVETTRSLAALSVSFGLPEPVVRGLALAAEVASAQSAEQVRSALEAVVAPVGTWRMKRRRPMVSLAALVGVGGGVEWALAGGGIIDPRPVGSLALLGAVGLDVSFPVRTSTVGGFLSVIDVGGLMSLPTGSLQATVLGEDGTTRPGLFEVSPRVSPEQVLSPGVYFRWGMFNTPLVLAVGGSITPLARHVQEVRRDGSPGGMLLSRDVSLFRAGVFLSADVTLFPF